MALILMTQMSTLFHRLDDKDKHKFSQMLLNRIMVDPDGQIVDYELKRPFDYLSKLANNPTIKLNGQSGSKQVPFGVPVHTGVTEHTTPRYGGIGDLLPLPRASIVAYSLGGTPRGRNRHDCQ
ncbi:MAG: hypothetical protein ACWGQW_10990 [bacterium]